MCADHQSSTEDNCAVIEEEEQVANYENILQTATTDIDQQHILYSFRKEYGWSQHELFQCCEGRHPIHIALKQKKTPLLSFADYRTILDTPEAEKLVYKRKIFI